jgi:LmbE family N-acetylglucosaminyl deacetylase
MRELDVPAAALGEGHCLDQQSSDDHCRESLPLHALCGRWTGDTTSPIHSAAMEPVPEEWQRAVAVAAHPDDLEYGAAAAFARWTSQGKEISYVLVTSGEAGIDSLEPDRARPLREEEERAAAAIVGVRHVEFLGHPDGAVEYGLPLRRDIASALRRRRPDVVFATNFELTWGDSGPVNHADHRAAGLAVLDACRDAANRWMYPELSEPWQGIRAVYVFAQGPPTHYVDVSDTFQKGMDSLHAHRAYLDALGGSDPAEFLLGFARTAGETAGCALAVTLRQMSV